MQCKPPQPQLHKSQIQLNNKHIPFPTLLSRDGKQVEPKGSPTWPASCLQVPSACFSDIKSSQNTTVNLKVQPVWKEWHRYQTSYLVLPGWFFSLNSCWEMSRYSIVTSGKAQVWSSVTQEAVEAEKWNQTWSTPDITATQILLEMTHLSLAFLFQQTFLLKYSSNT